MAAGEVLAIDARDVTVSYGSLQVLFGVTSTVREGEMVALLGTNGAGKSTLLKAMCGLTRDRRGPIDVGRRRHGSSWTSRADRIVRDGVCADAGRQEHLPDPHRRRAPPARHVDVPPRPRAGSRADLARRGRRVPGARVPLDTDCAGDLSGGEQQQLALAQTLMLRPRVLLIDELSLGLAPSVVAELLEIVRCLHADGMTIVLVEQSVNIALTLAERAVFMEKGAVRFEGPTRDLLDRPDILRAVFLGAVDRRRSATRLRQLWSR